jgi:hypothetical protein
MLVFQQLPQNWFKTASAPHYQKRPILTQAKNLTGTSPCLLAIPAFDSIAGLYNRHLTLTGEYSNANDFEVRLRTLTDLAKD